MSATRRGALDGLLLFRPGSRVLDAVLTAALAAFLFWSRFSLLADGPWEWDEVLFARALRGVERRARPVHRACQAPPRLLWRAAHRRGLRRLRDRAGEEGAAERFMAEIHAGYCARVDLESAVFACRPASGARLLEG